MYTELLKLNLAVRIVTAMLFLIYVGTTVRSETRISYCVFNL